MKKNTFKLKDLVIKSEYNGQVFEQTAILTWKEKKIFVEDNNLIFSKSDVLSDFELEILIMVDFIEDINQGANYDLVCEYLGGYQVEYAGRLFELDVKPEFPVGKVIGVNYIKMKVVKPRI